MNKTKAIVKEKKKVATEKDVKLEKIWQVLLINCDCHSYDDVVEGLMEAVGCTVDQAVQYAMVAEEFGQTSVFSGSHAECKKVERPLIRIGLRSSVEPL